MAYKVYKELERIIKIAKIKKSIDSVLKIAKTIVTIKVKLPKKGITKQQVMLLTPWTDDVRKYQYKYDSQKGMWILIPPQKKW